MLPIEKKPNILDRVHPVCIEIKQYRLFWDLKEEAVSVTKLFSCIHAKSHRAAMAFSTTINQIQHGTQFNSGNR